MRQLTVKYQSGLEVSLAAFLLRMTSHNIGRARRYSYSSDGKRSGTQDAGTLAFHNQKEERHERHSFQG